MKTPIVAIALLLTASCMPATESSRTEQQKAAPAAGMHVEENHSFTLEEAKRFRQQFEPAFTSWSGGGDLSRYVYLNMSEFWPHIVLSRTGHTRELIADHQDAVGDFAVAVDAGEKTVAEYVRNSPTDGVIVVHDRRVVFEDYPRMLPTDKHVWFSVSKTFVSTSVAILEDRGQINVDRPIDFYLQGLGGTAWEGIRIIGVLDMASGVDCPEVKSDADSCFWTFYDAFGWPVTERVQDDPMGTLQEMARLRSPGEVFDYTSVNTEVLNWLVEVVSGERFSDFVEREIWQRAGPESDALLASTANGAAFSAGGVSSNLRDLARYGMLFTPSVRAEGDPVVSDAYMDKIQSAGRPELTTEEALRSRNAMLGNESFRHNSYQWDIVTSDGDFYKGGFGGQGLYVSPSKNLVIA